MNDIISETAGCVRKRGPVIDTLISKT